MKVIILSIFSMIFFFINVKAQSISGTIHDFNTNKLISSANIIIKEIQPPNNIIDFKVVYNGIFSFKIKKQYKPFLINIKSYGYLDYEKVVNNFVLSKEYKLNVSLHKDNVLKLKEVVVFAKKKFLIKKDTISYNVVAYKDGTERKIIDLIKKLPGIQYNDETGKIQYNGKSIETVLLAGDNLFSYNYSLGIKNINVDMVNQVQAIEKYSANPLLKGIENDDKVALNLTLKKDKVDFSGNIDLGVGAFDKGKQALNISSNILGITKNYKSFGVLAYNNIGINYSPFDYFGFSTNIEQLKEKDYYAQKIIPETRFSNTIEDKRVNINNQYFSNYNAIYKINKGLKVKTNLYYVNDKITSKQLFKNQYIINNESFTTTDNYLILKKPKQYRGDIKVKYNASKNSLLEYSLKTRQENIETPSSVLSNGNNNFELLLNSKDFYLKQKLLFTNKISNKKAFQASIVQSTNNILQNYIINPSVISGNFSGNTQNSKDVKNYLKTQAILLGSTKRGNKYMFSVDGVLDSNKLRTELFNNNSEESITAINGINNIKYNKKSINQLGVYHINMGKFKLSPSYSVTSLHQKIKDNLNNARDTKTNYIIEPSLSINYRLNNVSFFMANAGYNKNSNAEKHLFINQILTNNRMTKSNTPSLELQKSLNYGFFYFNSDLYRQQQINLGVNYQRITGSFFSSSIINENTTQINYFYLPQNSSNLNFNFLIAKYVAFIQSTMKLSSNYNISEYKNVVNNSELRNNKSQFLNTKLYFKTAFNGFVNFTNTINYSKSISKSKNTNQFSNESLNNTFKIILKPSKKWFVLLSSDYFLPNIQRKQENYLFLDVMLKYKLKNKKLEFNFTAKNLLNEDNFEQIQTSDFSTNIYRTNILPRYYLLNMTFNF